MTSNNNTGQNGISHGSLPGTLQDIFAQHRGRYVAKVDSFFDVYEKHLFPYKGRQLRLLEIGVNMGGSLEIWRDYLGPGAAIHGIDIEPKVNGTLEGDITLHTGSQEDGHFLLELVQKHGPFDVVIDDGSHHFDHQIISFETLYPTMASNSIYICEDAFTSYWREYGGGVGRETFIEYAKDLIDQLHAYWAKDDGVEVTPFTRSTKGIYLYSGTVVFERSPVNKPLYVANSKFGFQELDIDDLKLTAEAQCND